MELLDLLYDVGLYAGVAAFLILPFLIPLYVQQARDVRRLREWADLTPDRGTAEFQAAEAAGVRSPAPLAPARAAARGRDETAPLPAAQRVFRELPAATRATTTEQRVAIREPWWRRFVRRPDPRYLVAIVAGVVLLGVGVGVLAVQIRESPTSESESGPGTPTVDPSDVRVAVLNGTATVGLAGKVGDQLQEQGFVTGAIANSPTQTTESQVQYQRGHEREAREVAKQLGIKQVEVITPEIEKVVATESEASAVEPAAVVVVAGEDRVAG